MLKNLPQNLVCFLVFGFVGFLSWRILLYGFAPVLSFSFWLDDWPLIWGVAQEKSTLFNPINVDFYFAQERFAVREGYLQVWSAAFLQRIFGFNPYWYHFYGFIAKIVSVLALTWAGWKLTRNLTTGVLAGILWAASFMGSESLYWFNVNAIYFLLAIFLVLLPFFIKGIQGENKSFAISVALISLSILLYSPRSHVLLALPLVAFIWHKQLINKKLLTKIVAVTAVIFLSFQFFFAEAGTDQVSRAILHRLYVFSKSGFEQGKSMFLTYPFLPITLAIFPDKLITLLSNLPKNEFFILGKLAVTPFRTWNFLVFPLLWAFLVYLLDRPTKNKKRLVFWLSVGGMWFILNAYLRKFVFVGSDWDWKTNFTFMLSGFLLLFSLSSFHFLRNHERWGLFAKTLPTTVFLIFVSYFFNWAFDPLIPPGSPNISRYMTLPSAFGALFVSVIFTWIYSLASEGKVKIPLLTPIAKKLIAGSLIFYMIFWNIMSNLEQARSFINVSLFPARSHQNVKNILDEISHDIEFGSPPPIVLVDSWDYGEVFAVLIYSGHSLAVWNNISNPEEFPLMYYDEKKLRDEFDNLCKRYSIDTNKIYKFKIEKDKAVNISSELPNLSCNEII